MKECSSCHQVKEDSEFQKSRVNKDRLHHYCRVCNSAAVAEWRKRNPNAAKESREARKEKISEYSKEYYKKQETQDRMRRNALVRKYGITVSDYDAMLVSQNSVCKICGEVNKDGKPLSVDHSHNTGKVRGLLCSKCNIALGMIRENESILSKMREYLFG